MKTLPLAGLASLLLLGNAHANLLLNGSFENGAYTGIPGGNSWTQVAGSTAGAITGWVATGGVDWHQDIAVGGEFGPAFDGIRMVDLTLDSTQGGIAQTFATIAGQSYHLSFAVAAPAGDSNFDVIVAGVTTSYFISGTNPFSMAWEVKEMDFVAIGGLTTLEFSGQTNNFWGAVIDNVSVTVPDQGAGVALLGLTVGAMVLIRRKVR